MSEEADIDDTQPDVNEDVPAEQVAGPILELEHEQEEDELLVLTPPPHEGAQTQPQADDGEYDNVYDVFKVRFP